MPNVQIAERVRGDPPFGAPATSARAARAAARAAEPARANEIVRGALARLAARPDLDAFLEHVLAAGVEQLAATSNALFTFDEGSRTFQLRAFVLGVGALDAAGPARPTIWTEPVIPRDGPDAAAAPSDVWPDAMAAVGVDPTNWPRSVQLHHALGHGSVLSVPLLVGGRPLGFMVARFADQTAPSTEQIAVAEALATQAALALELLRLADRAKDAAVVRARAEAAAQRTAELERTSTALQTTTDALASATELDEIVPMVLRIVGRTFSSSTAAFFDLGSDARMYLRYCLVHDRVLTAPEFLASGVGPLEVRQRLTGGLPVPDASFGSELGSPAERRGRGVIVDHRAATARETVADWACKIACELELHVLLHAGDDAVGVLTVYRGADAPYTDAEVALAEALAKLLALAVEGARLAAVARDRAVESAVARERARAADERSAVLARANAALQRGTARIAAQRGAATATTVLEAFVLEALAATGAVTGFYAQRVGEVGTEFALQALAVNGALAAGHDIQAADAVCRAVTGEDQTGIMRRVIEDESVVDSVVELSTWFPDGFPCPEVQTNPLFGHFPIRVAGVVTGFLGLVWPADAAPDDAVSDTARAIALQASLAVETQRFADEARAAAVAAERHAATMALADERTRLAREMHDTLAQGLAGIVMQLAAARAKLGPAYAWAAPQLDLVDGLARETLAVARRAITMLRPDAHQAEGLEGGLRRVIAEPGAPFGGRITLEVTGTPQRAAAEVEFELLRIARAALANAVQHAGATHIAVTLEYRAATRPDGQPLAALRIAVADDGAGFDAAAARPGRFGLVGMRERAARVGAALTLVTAPGEGTEVVVLWPDLGAVA